MICFFKRQSDRKKYLLFTGSLPKSLQQPHLGQAKQESRTLSGFTHPRCPSELILYARAASKLRWPNQLHNTCPYGRFFLFVCFPNICRIHNSLLFQTQLISALENYEWECIHRKDSDLQPYIYGSTVHNSKDKKSTQMPLTEE